MRTSIFAHGTALLAATLLAQMVSAQTRPDLTGFWELRSDSKQEAKPDLLPKAAEAAAKRAAARATELASGQLFPPGAPLCTNRGNMGGLGDSAPTAILQSPREIVFFFESTTAPRHIYMDGRSWPDPATLQASTTGYSIGRWDGDTLVIETRGFDPRHGQGAGGGYTLQTRVIERWQLVDGGAKLQVHWSFEDPSLYAKPYQFTWTYYRDPPDAYAAELVCDASDPKQAMSVVPPPQ